MKEPITSAELADVLGVSVSRVCKYKADGMPSCGKRGRSTIFDPAVVYEWITTRVTTRGDTTHGLVALAELAGINSPENGGALAKTPSDKRPGPEPPPSGGLTFDDVLHRARESELVAYNKYLQALTNGEAASALRLQKVWLNNADGLRRMEVDAEKIRKNKDESVSREYHERIMVESHSLVASAMSQGAKSIASGIVDEIRKHETHGGQVRAAYKLLDIELREMRRFLARELDKLG